MKSLIAIASIMLLGATTAPATAQTITDAPQAVVSYADLNLSMPAGRAALQQRLVHAVDQVCPTHDARELDGRQAYENCRSQAWDGIRRQLAQPLLAEVRIPAYR